MILALETQAGEELEGELFRNTNRNWISSFSKNFLEDTNNQMELISLNEGMKFVKLNNINPVEINIDSIEVILP